MYNLYELLYAQCTYMRNILYKKKLLLQFTFSSCHLEILANPLYGGPLGPYIQSPYWAIKNVNQKADTLIWMREI